MRDGWADMFLWAIAVFLLVGMGATAMEQCQSDPPAEVR